MRYTNGSLPRKTWAVNQEVGVHVSLCHLLQHMTKATRLYSLHAARPTVFIYPNCLILAVTAGPHFYAPSVTHQLRRFALPAPILHRGSRLG